MMLHDELGGVRVAKRRVRGHIAVLVAVALLVVAGCSADKADRAADVPGTILADAATSEIPESSAVAGPGTLRIEPSGEPTSSDVAGTTETDSTATTVTTADGATTSASATTAPSVTAASTATTATTSPTTRSTATTATQPTSQTTTQTTAQRTTTQVATTRVATTRATAAPSTTTTTAATTQTTTPRTTTSNAGLPAGTHPDIVKIIAVVGRSPGGDGWKDSYSVGAKCYCATTFDHDIGGIEVDTPAGRKTVREVCDKIGKGPGPQGRPIYNDIQCGNGPANNAGDEDDCPGRVDIGRDGCGHIGPRWDLTVFQ